MEQLTTATSARITALEETRDAHRVRADRAEADLDAARTENRRLAEQIAQAAEAAANQDATRNPHVTQVPGCPGRYTSGRGFRVAGVFLARVAGRGHILVYMR